MYGTKNAYISQPRPLSGRTKDKSPMEIPKKRTTTPSSPMNHTRKGKIARLPDQIREQVNLRLHDNEPGETILQWLNSKPEVQAILKAQFGGCPINKQNLSDWRQGGFRDWQTRQDALQFVEELDDEQALGPDSLTAPLGPRLAHWVGLHYAASAKALIAHEMDPAL